MSALMGAIFSLFIYPPTIIIWLLIIGIASGTCVFLYERKRNELLLFLAALGLVAAATITTQIHPFAQVKNIDVFTPIAGTCLTLVVCATTFTVLENLRERNVNEQS